MKLHEDKALFAEIIIRASQPKASGGLVINAGFIEKDYWITKALQQSISACVQSIRVLENIVVKV